MHETCISKLPRFQPIDRTQIFLRTTDVESLIAEDHPVRAIWIFLDRLRGVSSARQISREMEHEPGLQWLAGMEVVNHHTLSDFRVAHGSALQNLMEQVLGVLFSEGLVGLERVTQDGTKIRAQASKRSFLERKHLQQSLDLAKRHMANVDADNADPYLNTKRLLATASSVSAKQDSSLHCNH